MRIVAKQMKRKLSISAVALLIVISVMTACSSIRSGGNSAENTKTGTGQPITGENNQTSPGETSKREKQTDILGSFKIGSGYKTDIRPKIVKDGWQPARTEEGDDNCASSMEICKEYPELEGGPAAGMGNIVFRWKKGDKVLLVHTVDDPPIYDSYDFEKPSQQIASKSLVLGRYVYRYREDYGGAISFVFKAGNKLDYEWSQEDLTRKGVGNWKWDEAKQILTATVFTEPEADSAAESEKKPPRQEIFVFQKTGNDLKLITAPSGMDVYKSKVFQKK